MKTLNIVAKLNKIFFMSSFSVIFLWLCFELHREHGFSPDPQRGSVTIVTIYRKMDVPYGYHSNQQS